jgi:tyrosine aminotransferase
VRQQRHTLPSDPADHHPSPSNPCGSNFSRQHLLDILAFAAAHYLPVITDEIYGELVFAGEHFYPLANLNASHARNADPTASASAPAPSVPVLTVGGLAKRWLVPGWRMGWILVHDPEARFGFPVRQKLKDVATVALAPSSITQAALPAILRDTPRAFYEHVRGVVEGNARACTERLARVEGLKVVEPKGSLYMMVGVDTSKFEGIADEWDFVQKLVWEEAVFPVPGRVRFFVKRSICRAATNVLYSVSGSTDTCGS